MNSSKSEPIGGGLHLSVVICTHNRSADVADCLAALVPQINHDMMEVLVVDSGSSEQERQALSKILSAWPTVRFHRIPTPGVSAARNAGVSETTGSWIAYIDDDAVVTPDWAENAVRLTFDVPPQCGIIAGTTFPLIGPGEICPSGKRWQQMLSIVNHDGEGDVTETGAMVSANAIFRRSALTTSSNGFTSELGRHGQSLLSGEEKMVQQRLVASGWRMWGSHRLRAGHKVNSERLTKKWITKRAYWDGISDQRIRALNAQKPTISEVAGVLAKSVGLAAVYYVGRSKDEFFIRYWYNAGWFREWLLPVGSRKR
jgi:glycosyltransferase involved in cell wall biosynthesis